MNFFKLKNINVCAEFPEKNQDIKHKINHLIKKNKLLINNSEFHQCLDKNDIFFIFCRQSKISLGWWNGKIEYFSEANKSKIISQEEMLDIIKTKFKINKFKTRFKIKIIEMPRY